MPAPTPPMFSEAAQSHASDGRMNPGVLGDELYSAGPRGLSLGQQDSQCSERIFDGMRSLRLRWILRIYCDATHSHRYYIIFEVQALAYETAYNNNLVELLKKQKGLYAHTLVDPSRGGKLISKSLQNEAPQSLFALKRDQASPHGEPIGAFTHDEE